MVDLSLALVPVLLIALWIFTSASSATFPTLQGKRICLLIAHPDDEAMFFAPTLLALTKPALGNHIKILCLSNGNADGLGAVREKELVKSALLLGLRSANDVLVVNDPAFPDSMTTTWDGAAIVSLLASTFAPKAAKTSAKAAPEASIDVLITFDRRGVSGHPNHTSLYHGAVVFLRFIMQRHAGWDCPVKLYTLTSVNVVRKYASIFEAPLTVARAAIARKEAGLFPTPLLFVSGPFNYRAAQTAMTTAHESQMRWFRWGWIGVSRYMIINDLRREAV